MADMDDIFQAAKDGKLETTQDNLARLQEKDKTGHTVLYYAAKGGHRLLVETLLVRGAQLDFPDSIYQPSAPLSYLWGSGGLGGAVQNSVYHYNIYERKKTYIEKEFGDQGVRDILLGSVSENVAIPKMCVLF